MKEGKKHTDTNNEIEVMIFLFKIFFLLLFRAFFIIFFLNFKYCFDSDWIVFEKK